jgi:hypothetical protein
MMAPRTNSPPGATSAHTRTAGIMVGSLGGSDRGMPAHGPHDEAEVVIQRPPKQAGAAEGDQREYEESDHRSGLFCITSAE